MTLWALRNVKTGELLPKRGKSAAVKGVPVLYGSLRTAEAGRVWVDDNPRDWRPCEVCLLQASDARLLDLESYLLEGRA